MKYEQLAFVAFGALMVAGTLGFLVQSEPENTNITSSDNQLSVTGTARSTQPIAINVGQAVAAPLLGKQYEITPAEITLDRPATLTFALPVDKNSDSLAVFRYQPTFMMWEPLATSEATESGLATEVSTLGAFALGKVETVTAPEFLAAEDDLRALAPANTVGYEIAIGYARNNSPTLRLPSLGETGGCGGQVRTGDGAVQSMVTREVQVPVDDVLTTVTFVFVSSWVTSSQGGCAEAAPLTAFSAVL